MSELGVKEKAHLIGAVSHEEIPGLITSMDVCLAPYPSLTDFYFSPLKIFEYMACGVPVVASNIGQITEIIEDGINGFLCEPGDNEMFADKILDLKNNDFLRKQISKNAIESVVLHSWDNVVNKIIGAINLKKIVNESAGV